MVKNGENSLIENLLIAKSFGAGQPARTAQADLGRNFLQMH